MINQKETKAIQQADVGNKGKVERWFFPATNDAPAITVWAENIEDAERQYNEKVKQNN